MLLRYSHPISGYFAREKKVFGKVWHHFFKHHLNNKNLETILKLPAKLMPQLQMMIEQFDITPWLCLAVVQHLRADRGCVSWTMVVYHWDLMNGHCCSWFLHHTFKFHQLPYKYQIDVQIFLISWLILLFPMNVLSIKAIQCLFLAWFYSILSETSVNGEILRIIRTPVLSDVSLIEAPEWSYPYLRAERLDEAIDIEFI